VCVVHLETSAKAICVFRLFTILSSHTIVVNGKRGPIFVKLWQVKIR